MAGLFSGSALRGVKVLVIEDDADARDMLSMLLAASGGEVKASSSAADGYSAIAHFHPDVIVSDVHMPGEDGLTFMRRVRALPFDEGGLTPSIAVSGGASPQEALDAGFHGHLTKPFDPAELLEVIRSFVRPTGESQASWSIRSEPEQLVVAFFGYVTGADMATVARAVAAIVEASEGGRRVIVDLHKVTGFEASVGSAAQSGVWRVRHKILHATIAGGTPLARLIGRTACTFLSIPVTTVD
jgi:CheY-like chemotaxis protein